MLALALILQVLCIASASPVREDTECISLPVGAGPTVTPDTPSAFVSYTSFAISASAAPTPSGYVNTFTNKNAENAALGFHGSFLLQNYDSTVCAAMCDANDGCMAFNLAFERAPSVDPGANCTNPPSTTYIKCTLWAGPVTKANAINSGQYREDFQVVVAGSNGYMNQSIKDCPGYTGPKYLANAAISAPLDCNGLNTSLGYKYWNDGLPFDAARCAAACTAQTSCQFFNTFVLINSALQNAGQYCAMFSESWEATYAAITALSLGGQSYSLSHSYSFSNSTDSGVCTGASFTALGCYQDQYNPRVLPYRQYVPSSELMTVELCSSLCSGYPYFGVEYAQECYCGSNLTLANQLGGADNCNMACQGNPAEPCGGSLALNIFSQVSQGVSTSTSTIVSSATYSSISSSSTTIGSRSGTSTSTASVVSSSTTSTAMQSSTTVTTTQSSTTTTTTQPSVSTQPCPAISSILACPNIRGKSTGQAVWSTANLTANLKSDTIYSNPYFPPQTLVLAGNTTTGCQAVAACANFVNTGYGGKTYSGSGLWYSNANQTWTCNSFYAGLTSGNAGVVFTVKNPDACLSAGWTY